MMFVHCWMCRLRVTPRGRRVLAFPDTVLTREQVNRICQSVRLNWGLP